MANGGWYGTTEEWERIEAPIKSLDSTVDHFASHHSLSVTRNYKDWPSRSMAWNDDVECLIQLYLDDVATLGINLWICASQDRGYERYWKREFLCKGAAADDIGLRLPELLDLAKATLDHWSSHPEQLEFATKIAKI